MKKSEELLKQIKILAESVLKEEENENTVYIIDVDLDPDKAFELSGEKEYPEFYNCMFFSNKGKLESHDWGSMYITELNDFKVFKTKEEAFNTLKRYIQRNEDPLIPAINEVYITEVKPLSPDNPEDLKLMRGGCTYYSKNIRTNKWDEECNPWGEALTNKYTLQDFLS